MRVALIADSHYSEASRFEETIRLHDVALSQFAAADVDLILHAGDVYDRRSTARERDAVATWLALASDIAPVVVVRGNHDVPGDLALFDPHLADGRYNVRLAEQPTTVKLTLEGVGAVVVSCLPWPRQQELLAALPPMGVQESSAVARACLQDVLRGFSGEYAGGDGPALIGALPCPRILLAHALVTGSVTSTGQPLVGHDMELCLEDLALAGADVVALGHIHKGQSWSFEREGQSVPIVYPGSPRRTAFGELESKGWTLLELTWCAETRDEPAQSYGSGVAPPVFGSPAWERRRTGRWACKTTHMALPATPMVLIEADWDEGALRFPSDAPDLPDLVGAEVRLRVAVATDQRDAAGRAARSWAESARDIGAVSVKVEEDVIATTRARVPEIATVTTIEAKLDALWTSRAEQIAPERRARLHAYAAELERADPPVGAAASRTVRVTRLRAHAMGPFDEVDVNLDGLEGVLSVEGENGAGKTTLLELLPAAMYRSFPTRGHTSGKLGELAGERVSHVTVDVVTGDGAKVELHHVVDAMSDAGKSLVTVNGAAKNEGGKRKTFDDWALDNLPLKPLYLASAFAGQGGGRAFLNLDPGERKAVLLRLIGAERFERMSEEARRRANQATARAGKVTARLEEHRASCPTPVADLEARLETVRGDADRLAVDRVAARVALDQARAAERERQALVDAAAARDDQRAQLLARREDLDLSRWGRQLLVSQAEDLRDDVAGVLAAEASLPTLSAEYDLARQAEVGAARDLDDVHGALGQAVRAEDTAKSRLNAAVTDLSRAEHDMRAYDGVTLAVESLPAFETALATAEQACGAASVAYEALRAQDVERDEHRILGLRAGLEIVLQAPTWPEALAAAHGTLDQDDARAKAMHDRPGKLGAAQHAAREAGLAVVAARARRDTAARRAALAEPMKTAEQTLGRRASAALEARSLLEQAEAACRAAAALVGPAERAKRSHVEVAMSAFGKLAAARKLAERVLEARAVETRLVELRQLIVSDSSAIEEVDRGLLGLPPIRFPAAPPAHLRIDHLDAEFERLERLVTAIAGRMAAAEHDLDRARLAALRLADLEQEAAAEHVVLGDWTKLGLDLGRKGVQALEIDAAGPELAEQTNDLLRACFSHRWTVSFDTLRDGKDGAVEGYQVNVLDTLTNTSGSARALSGGEKTIIGEAVSLALCAMQMNRAGIRGATLVRDESGAALCPEWVPGYVAMLRRAREVTGASAVLFVCHNPTAGELADARIVIKDRKVSVVR